MSKVKLFYFYKNNVLTSGKYLFIVVNELLNDNKGEITNSQIQLVISGFNLKLANFLPKKYPHMILATFARINPSSS